MSQFSKSTLLWYEDFGTQEWRRLRIGFHQRYKILKTKDHQWPCYKSMRDARISFNDSIELEAIKKTEGWLS